MIWNSFAWERSGFSPTYFIQSLIIVSVWIMDTYFLLWVIIQYSFIYLVAHTVSALATGSFPIGFCAPLTYLHQCVLICVCVCVCAHSLTFWHYKILQAFLAERITISSIHRTFLMPNIWGFIELSNSDTNYLELAKTLWGQRASPTRLLPPPFQMPFTSSGPTGHQHSCLTWLQIGGSLSLVP